MKDNLKGALLWWAAIPLMIGVIVYGIKININWILAPVLGIAFVSFFGIAVYISKSNNIKKDLR